MTPSKGGLRGGLRPLKSRLIEACSLRAAAARAGLLMSVEDGVPRFTPQDPADDRYSADFILPSERMVAACRADDHAFLAAWVAAGLLTAPQAAHAAASYRLGKTRTGRTLFWMIDELLQPLDARIEAPAATDTPRATGAAGREEEWLSTLLRRRLPLLARWRADHCLFGMHLAGEEEWAARGTRRRPVCVVEREASAVVLSELFPEATWMAYVSPTFLTAERLAPLRGRAVTLYPPATLSADDLDLACRFAADVRRRFAIDVAVADILHRHATDEQKARACDLADFIWEAGGNGVND